MIVGVDGGHTPEGEAFVSAPVQVLNSFCTVRTPTLTMSWRRSIPRPLPSLEFLGPLFPHERMLSES